MIGGIGLFQDVSERMRVEESVRASERLLNGIFELLPVGVVIADKTGHIVRVNQAAIRIWGGVRYGGRSEYSEYRAWWADSGEAIPADEWALARAIDRGEISLGEVIRIQCFDGTFKTVINSALPLCDDNGQPAGAIVVNEDITRLKDTEDALRQAVESREHVLEIVAHDLRHPLQVIFTLVEVLDLDKGRPQTDRDALHNLANQVRSMDRLIQDLLDVARADVAPIWLSRSPVAPATLVNAASDAHQVLAAASHVTLSTDVERTLPQVNADHRQIARVFANLIANALAFTPSGGQITLGAARDGEVVRFWTADSGRGIDAETATKMFARRWQAEPGRRGAGLGLAIAKAIVDAHGGRIWAESAVGRGTLVCFTIPSVAG